MRERVVEFDLGVTWEPNAPEGVFISDDYGRAALAMNAHFNDEDQRSVVVRWDGMHAARSGYPNDQGRGSHRFYSRGLKDVLWSGIVVNSGWQHQLGISTVRKLDHFVVLTKENTIEVLASGWEVLRLDGPTRTAASAALH
jgi:hypothetical protein